MDGRGIEANLKKVRVIPYMPFPRSIRDVEKLTGCMAALGRFTSKSVKRYLPFFEVLKGAQKFSWTEECKRPLESLKTYLVTLLRITKPVPGEELYLYASVSIGAVSTVLI